MRKTLKQRLVAVLTFVSVLAGSLAFFAAPAQAYGNGLWQWVSFNTGSCAAVGGYDFGVSASTDYCYVEGVRYKKDSGGIGLYSTFIPNYCCLPKKEVFRVEWHPHGEILRVCDLANDDDTIHTRLRYKSYNWYWQPLLSPPGTSATVDCRDGNYDFVEGTEIRIYLYDDKAMSEFMVAYYNLRA